MTSKFNWRLKTLLICLLATFFVVSFGLRFLGSHPVQGAETHLDLSGEWDVCNECSSGAITETWTKARVPETEHSQKFKFRIFRRKFVAPSYCFEQDREGCSFVLGGAHSGVQVAINDTLIASHLTAGNTYPLSAYIPARTLSRTNPNTIELRVWPTRPAISARLENLPIGIISPGKSFRVLEALQGGRLILPLWGAFICFALALISSVGIFSSFGRYSELSPYVVYCLISAAYLLNLTRIPREIFPPNLGHSLNFASRFLYDSVFLSLVSHHFYGDRNRFKIINWSFYSAAGVILASGLYCDLIPGALQIGAAPWSSRVGGPIYNLSTWFLIADILPFAMALYFSIFRHFATRIKILMATFFFVILYMDVIDLLLLSAWITDPYENYYARLYPPFVAFIFGFHILVRLREREMHSQRHADFGKSLAFFAHDLRSPIASLTVLSRTESLSKDGAKLLQESLANIQLTLQQVLKRGKEDLLPLEIHRMDFSHVIRTASNEVSYARGGSVVIFGVTEGQKYLVQSNSPTIENDLQRSIVNLLNNSLDNAKTDSSIAINFRNSRSRVSISIQDNGTGISRDLLYQFNTGRFGATTREEGSGFGLQQVKSTVESLQGTLTFQNMHKGGLAVEISFDAKPEL